jgi:Flp pilus assembly protein TadD
VTLSFVSLTASFLLPCCVPASGQSNWETEYTQQATTRPATVSADLLRHSVSSKGLRLLQKALHLADLGSDDAAIQSLREAIAKEPSIAPYAYSWLGLEYLRTKRFAEANDSLLEAARLMPNESANHSNLGISLALIGEWDSAANEERKALELDHANLKAKNLLAYITSWKESHRE